MQMISPLWQKVKRTKKPLDEMKEESEKVTQHSDNEDHGIQDGEAMETVRDFILGGSKITVDGHCSHEIKRCLLLEVKL